MDLPRTLCSLGIPVARIFLSPLRALPLARFDHCSPALVLRGPTGYSEVDKLRKSIGAETRKPVSLTGDDEDSD